MPPRAHAPEMGLNEFVSLFYGSSQSLNSNKIASASTYSLPTVANWKDFQQMLKNHKNVQAKKYGYKDYHPSEVKYSNLYAGLGTGGNGGGGGDSRGGDSRGGGARGEGGGHKKLLNNNSSSTQNNNIANPSNSAKTSRIPTTTKSMTSSASSSGGSDLDIFRSYSKKSLKSSLTASPASSSFLWTSFRMPRKQKSSLAEKKRGGE